ncbi:MAG: hypothetical protein AAGD18_12155 [Actinomycetota bacterium]
MAQVIRQEAHDGSASVVEAHEDGSIVVEADTPEEAMALARRRLGDDLQVREAVRTERGGLRGFFAREVYRVEAEPSVASDASNRPEVDALVRRIEAAADASSTTGRADEGIGRALDRVNSAEEEFGALLRRELGSRGLRSWSEDAAVQRELDHPAAEASASSSIDLRDPASTPRPSSPVPVGPAAGGRSAMPVLPPAPVPPDDAAAVGSLSEPMAAPPSEPRVLPAAALVAQPEREATSEREPAAAPVARSEPRPAATALAEPPVVAASAPMLPRRPEQSRTDQSSPLAERVAAPAVLRAPTGDGAPTAGRVDHPAPTQRAASIPPPTAASSAASTVDRAVTPTTVDASPVTQLPETSVVLDDPLVSAPPPGEVLWSVDRLAHLGLPFTVVEATVGLDPTDDFAWLQRLAERFADFVHTPSGRSVVFAGPRADRVAIGLGLPCVTPPELPPYGGSIGLKTIDDGAGRAWLGRVRGDRELHVVMSGRAWELLLTKEPTAVVAEGPDKVVAALQTAVEHGVRISHLLDGRHIRRANPLDLAIAVRSLVGRR